MSKLSKVVYPLAVTYFFEFTFIGGKGKSVSLLKNSSKRKRNRAELEEVKDEESKLKLNPQMFYQEAKRLKHDYGDLEDEVVKLRGMAHMSQSME